ncbi:hypothetical protein ACHAQJ_002463 [Trichoderma viride]
MASKKANAKFNLATQPSIPTRFRCKVGGEWKPLDAFSKNQHRFIQFQIDGRRRIDAANSGMTCREHTSGQRTEMTCVLCGLVKPLDEFSGSSKKNESAHCKRCTAWVETQEPEVIPAPLETGHISIEEERGEMWPATFVDSSDFFSDDILPQAPVTGLSSLGLEDLDPSHFDVASLLSAPSEDSVFGGVAGTTSSYSLPPHLRGKIPGSASASMASAEKSKNAETSSQSSLMRQLPPHLRGIMMQQSILAQHQNDPSVSGETEYNPGSISTATTAREMKVATRPRRVSFNAWDPKGIPHRGIKSVTASSFADNSVGAVSDAGQSPTYPEVQGKGGWAKSKHVRMTQTELRQAGTNHHIAARQVGPVKHRPPQHDFDKFCEPDEDDADYWD